MKIVYFCSSLTIVGGYARVITLKANYLADVYGYDVTVITVDDGYELPYKLSAKVKHIDLGIRVYCLSMFNLRRLINTIRLFFKLKKVLLKEKADYVLSQVVNEALLLLKMKDGSRKIVEAHFPYVAEERFSKTLSGKISLILKRALVKGCDKFVTLTRKDAECWHWIRKDIIIIPNPTILPFLGGTYVKRKQIIAVGRLTEAKGYDILVDIWKIVADRHPDWKLVIYGDGECRTELEEKIKKNNLADSFILAGFTNDVYSKMQESAMFVMSSRFEGYPMALIEAMACGLPCVSFDIHCGPSDIINDGVNGFLVEFNDIRGMADKIMLLIENPELLLDMSCHSVEKSKSFDSDIVMDNWKRLFL